MKADALYNGIPQIVDRTLQAPIEFRFVDGARLTLNQVNYLLALLVASDGNVALAQRAFRMNHKMVRRGCCLRKWHPILTGDEDNA